MTIEEAIELGKTKIDPRNNDLGDNPERIYEILGFTNAKFFGWNTIRHIRHFEYHGQTHGYFQYVCHKLVKCSFKQALITPDYKNFGIFIFSFQKEDDFWDYSEYYNTPRVVLIYKYAGNSIVKASLLVKVVRYYTRFACSLLQCCRIQQERIFHCQIVKYL